MVIHMCDPKSACNAASHLWVEVSDGSACPDFCVHVALFDPQESWGKVDTDVSWFRLGRKTANFTGAVSWSTNSICQVRLLTVVNNIYSLYNDKKKESCTTITTTRAFISVISWLAITASSESVLSKLMLIGTVKLWTLDKAAVVVKRVARAFSLLSAEPAFNLLLTLFGIFFYGSPDPWIHGSDSPVKRIAGAMVEKPHPEARVKPDSQ